MITKEYLEKEYLENNRTTREIAQDCDVDKTTIIYWLKKYNIPRQKSGQRLKGKIGQRFNNLVILKKVKLKRHFGWLCQCDCGNLVKAEGAELAAGRKYCWNCRNQAISKRNWTGYGEISGDFWNSIKRSSVARKIDFQITIEYAWSIFLKQDRKCSLSGVELTFKRNNKDELEKTASLDRIDSSKGYTEGNIQWIHKDINKMKMDLPEDIFINLCCRIAKNYKNGC